QYMSRKFGAKAVARHELTAYHKSITTAFKVEVGVTGKLGDGKATRVEPLIVIDHFRLPLWILEPARNKAASIDQASISSKDDIGQRLYWLHRFDCCSCLSEIGNKIMPLLLRQVPIGCVLGMHPGIDFIKDTKVVWRTHEIASTPRKWLCFSRGIIILR